MTQEKIIASQRELLENQKGFDKRIEKIESWLMFEGGNFYWEMFTTLLRYSAYFFLGYLLLSVVMQVMTVTLLETLPQYCASIENENLLDR